VEAAARLLLFGLWDRAGINPAAQSHSIETLKRALTLERFENHTDRHNNAMSGRFPTGALQPGQPPANGVEWWQTALRFFPAFSGVFFVVFLRPLSLGNQSGASL
jgi:hypothetical protein